MDLSLINALTDELKKTALYQQMKETENKMMEDSSLFPLFMKYQTQQSILNDAMRLNLDYKKDKEKLLLIKQELEAKPLVKTYLEAYRAFNLYLNETVKLIYKDVIDETLINNPLSRWIEL